MMSFDDLQPEICHFAFPPVLMSMDRFSAVHWQSVMGLLGIITEQLVVAVPLFLSTP